MGSYWGSTDAEGGVGEGGGGDGRFGRDLEGVDAGIGRVTFHDFWHGWLK